MNNTVAIMRYMQNLKALAAAVYDEMRRQNLNTYEVADRARKKGYKIVHGTVWNVINCNVKEVKDKSIVAIAQGLGLPEQTLFSIVRGNETGIEAIISERFIRIASWFAQLPTGEKEKIEPFVFALEESLSKFLPSAVQSDQGQNLNKRSKNAVIEKFLDRSEERDEISDEAEIKKPSRRKAS